MLRTNIERKREPYKKFAMWLKEQNIPQAEVAKLLGKGVSAVNQNINGTGGDFTVGEVTLICRKYHLSAEEYFFEDRVSKTKRTSA